MTNSKIYLIYAHALYVFRLKYHAWIRDYVSCYSIIEITNNIENIVGIFIDLFA